MSLVVAVLLLTCAATGTAVVLVREPRRQAFAIGLNGLVLALLFTALQAPDVALSEIAVGTVVVPLLFLIAIAATRTNPPDAASGASADSGADDA